MAAVTSVIPKRRTGGLPKLLVLDAAYSLSQVRDRRAEHTVTTRDLAGFFKHVWSVHPLVGADPERHGLQMKGLEITQLSPRHTVVEARTGRFPQLARLPMLNFVVSQGSLLLFLARLTRREAVSVIRAGDPYYLGILGWFLASLARVPLVIRVNGNYDAIYEATGRPAYPRLFRKRSTEKRIERFVFPRAQLVAGANQNNLDYAIANGASRERTTLFRYGSLIDPVHFSDPDSRPRPVDLGERRWITYVGRLEDVKHVDDLIPVLAHVREGHPDAGLLIVGDGSMRDRLISLVEQAGQKDAVILAGDRTQPWIAEALAASAVIVSPMTGRALVEAGLSGTPIVAYDVEWHAELIVDEECGLLVPYRDTAAMAAAVERLLSDGALSTELALSCRRRTAHMMDPGRLLAHEVDSYRALLGLGSVR